MYDIKQCTTPRADLESKTLRTKTQKSRLPAFWSCVSDYLWCGSASYRPIRNWEPLGVPLGSIYWFSFYLKVSSLVPEL